MRVTVQGHSFEADPSYADHFQDEMDLLEAYWHPAKDDVVVDVGAGAGRYSMPALSAGAQVIAIEPRTDWSAALENQARANGFEDRLTLLRIALCDGAAPDDLLTMIEARFAELAPRDATWTTLDDLVKELDLVRLDWVKIDVEGQELGVLEGGREVITHLMPTLFIEDHSLVYPSLGMAHHDRLLDWLHRAGYNVTDVPYVGSGIPRGYLLCQR